MHLLLAPLLAATACAQQPSLIFILLDDLGNADVSFSHKLNRPDMPPSIETPGIDFLANSAIKLQQYYTHHICAPSRAAFLTARYHTNLGNPFPAPGGAGSLPAHYKTLADELSDRSYRSYYVGKWGVDGDGSNISTVAVGSGFGPTERGFDEFYGILFGAHDHYSKLNTFKPLGVVDINRFTKGGPHKSYPDVDPEPEMHSTRLFTREAISFLAGHMREHAGTPFFLQLSYTAPHDPLLSDAEWIAHPSCVGIKNWRRRVYCGMVVGVDQGIANLTQAMQDLGVNLDNTIIIFSSDNGGMPVAGGFNTPYRGTKGGSWEGCCRVPGFIRAPALLGGAGRVWPGLMHIVDWAPTILSLVDGSPGNHSLLDEPEDQQGPIDGIDVSAALRASSASPRKDALLVSDMFLNRSALVMQAPTVVGGKEAMWKLVLGHTGESEVFTVPEGSWTYNNGDFLDKVDEVVRDSMIKVLGEEYFIFEMAFHLVITVIKSKLTGTPDEWQGAVYGADSPMSRLANVNDTLQIQHNLPVPDWSAAGRGLWLFNLDEDPQESIDLSEVHQELTGKMTARLVEIIERAPPQHGGSQFMLQMLARVTGCVLLLISVLCFCTVGCCFSCCRGFKEGCRKRALAC